ncbi:MAG: hypothetical protein OWS74_06155 [Firmicutes bacterium]|nr:hypothetical protein [Bacillota bacterium]
MMANNDFLRSWGYAIDQPITSYAEQRLNDLLETYHRVQTKNVVDELDVTAAILGKSLSFSELTIPQAQRIGAHLSVRIALYTHFAQCLPPEPLSFNEEISWLTSNRSLLERVLARAGWDTAEYFLPAQS